MEIEVLTVAGCPHRDVALDRLRDALWLTDGRPGRRRRRGAYARQSEAKR
jgi:hypothetical protein